LRLFIAVVLALSAGAAAAPAPDPIRVGVYSNPPKVVLTDHGAEGIYADLLEHIAKTDGLRLAWVPGTFQEGLDRLERGDIDVMVDVGRTPERELLFDFNKDPVLQSWNEIFLRRGVKARDFRELGGLSVGVLRGSVQDRLFQKEAAQSGVASRIVPFDSYEDAFAAARAGRVDAVAANPFVGQAFSDGMRDSTIVFGAVPLHFAVRKGSAAALLAAIDRQLPLLRADPESSFSKDFQALVNAQHGSRLPPWFWSSAAAAAAVALIAIAWLVSSRHKTARLLAAEAQERHASEALRRVFEHSMDIMCVLDDQLNIRRINPAVEALGHSPQALAGMPFADLLAPAEQEAATATLLGLGPAHPAKTFDTCLVRSSGEPVDSTCAATWSELMREFYVILRDDSQRRALLRAVEARSAALEAVNGDLRMLAFSLSHDLRQPISALNSFLEVLRRRIGPTLEPASEHYFDRCAAAGARIDEMVKELGELLEVAGTPVHRQRCDVTALVSEIAGFTTHAHGEPNVEVEVAPGMQAWADPRLLKRLLENLLSNAVKYSSKVDRPKVRVAATEVDGIVVFSVSDNGVGFDPQYQDNLFKPFSRLHTRDEFPGSGMGLAIASRAVTQHGGQIWAETRPGAGTTFRFTLGPADSQPAAAASGAPAAALSS
jgi:signal transduction histidine kinase/ABC-type amino acid transport substrate-binding protein